LFIDEPDEKMPLMDEKTPTGDEVEKMPLMDEKTPTGDEVQDRQSDEKTPSPSSGMRFTKLDCPHWVDMVKGTLERVMGSQVVSVLLKTGPNGFAVASLDESGMTWESEVPNLVLTIEKKKLPEKKEKPPTIMKRTAAAKASDVESDQVGEADADENEVAVAAAAVEEEPVVGAKADEAVEAEAAEDEPADEEEEESVVGAEAEEAVETEAAEDEPADDEPVVGAGAVEKEPAVEAEADDCDSDKTEPYEPPSEIHEPPKYKKMWYIHGNRYGVRRTGGDKKQVWQLSSKAANLNKEQLGQVIDAVLAKMNRGELSEEQGKEPDCALVNLTRIARSCSSQRLHAAIDLRSGRLPQRKRSWIEIARRTATVSGNS